MHLLVALASAPEQQLSKEQLLEVVWKDKVVSDETLSVAISHLRKALGCNAKKPVYIETISGYGFRLLVPSEPNGTYLSFNLFGMAIFLYLFLSFMTRFH